MNDEEMKNTIYQLLKENLGISITEQESMVKIELFFDGKYIDEDYIDLVELKKQLTNPMRHSGELDAE